MFFYGFGLLSIPRHEDIFLVPYSSLKCYFPTVVACYPFLARKDVPCISMLVKILLSFGFGLLSVSLTTRYMYFCYHTARLRVILLWLWPMIHFLPDEIFPGSQCSLKCYSPTVVACYPFLVWRDISHITLLAIYFKYYV